MSSSFSENPYAVSGGSMAAASGQLSTDVESIRKQYLSHEASVKSIGLLYWLGGIILSLMTVAYLIGGVGMMLDSKTVADGVLRFVLAIFIGSLAVFQIIVARAIGKLKPWSRIAATVLSCIGLLGFPIGTLINGYFLYLLQSKKGEYVFSAQYQQVIAATPHIKYKTSIIVWILLGILLVLIGMGVLGLVFSAVSVRR